MNLQTTTPPRAADTLALGFGTTVAIWGIAYFSRLLEQSVHHAIIIAVMLCLAAALIIACQLAAGYLAGRYGPAGLRSAVWAGLLTGVLNLLATASLFGGDQPNRIEFSALFVVPGTILFSVLLATCGALAGHLLRRPTDAPPDWAGAFAAVAPVATFLLLAIGGVVTGTDEGLAVVDWPNTETYNMFLYPLERMTGGIFLEHSHRLFGSLVGLTVLVLAIQIQVSEQRGWVKLLGWFALAIVVFQGILGGLRVTGVLTLSDDPDDTNPSVVLAIIHGVFGQLVFAVLVALAIVRSRAWRFAPAPHIEPTASTDRAFGLALVIALIGQLVLGALVRHFTWALRILRYGLETPPDALIKSGQWALNLHITVAVVVALLVLGVGVRALALYRQLALLRRLGAALLILVGCQVTLGVIALVVTGDDTADRRPSLLDVSITTLHQVVGAALLAGAVLHLLWHARRVRAAPRTPAVPTPTTTSVGPA